MGKDIPIIFSGPMVRALLDGRKTQTRRMVSLQNCEFGSIPNGKLSKLFWDHADWKMAWADLGFPNPAAGGAHTDGYLHVPCHDLDRDKDCWCELCQDRGWAGTSHRLRPRITSYDRLWVREAVARIDNSEFDKPSYWEYRADTDGECFPGEWPAEEKDNPDRPRWKPAIHMPRVASRLSLPVASVRVERLQAISDDDVMAEGVCSFVSGTTRMFGVKVHGGYKFPGLSSRESFMNLWCEINGPSAWNDNPFVVATTFRVIKANIDSTDARAAA